MARKKRDRGPQPPDDEAAPEADERADDEEASAEAAASEPASDERASPDRQAPEPERLELTPTADLPALPSFARVYPDDPELRALVKAFADGNYARVREEAPKLAQRAGDPAVAEAARDLRRRIEPDPLAVSMLIGMGLLLMFLTLYFYTHRH